MPDQAQVRSVEAIEAFRADLVVYLHKVRPLVDEIGTDLRRTQYWLENDRRQHWRREIARRTRVLEAAQQALLSARLATFKEPTPVEQNAVHAARRSLEEAHERTRTLERWIREFGPRTDPLARQLAALESMLAQDLPKAVAHLARAIELLETYSEKRPVSSPPPP